MCIHTRLDEPYVYLKPVGQEMVVSSSFPCVTDSVIKYIHGCITVYTKYDPNLSCFAVFHNGYVGEVRVEFTRIVKGYVDATTDITYVK